MAGTIELDPSGKELRIRFDYDPYLVAEIKGLPRRRWDPGQKAWRVPAEDVDATLTLLMRHGFEVAPEVSGLLAGTTGKAATTEAEPAKARPAKKKLPEAGVAASGTGAEDALTISALNERVRQVLKGAFADSIWVVGEIVDYDKNKAREHVFFTLVEKRTGDEKVAAQVSVALFKDVAARVQKRLAEASDPVALRDGIAVRVRVRVDFYAGQGRFQLVIEEIDPGYTLGQLALQREQILKELRTLGLLDRNRELPLPIPPLRVGVLASPDSDGWNDFLKELEGSGVGFAVTVYAVKVQGTELRPTMLAGLAWFAARAADFDVLCVLRGGGSRSDLAWFDDREVALAVAQHPLKVVCGIGHQRDQSVLDLIAHSEKTPTAVAAFLVRQVLEAVERLAESLRRLADATTTALRGAHDDLATAANRLRYLASDRLATAHEVLRDATRRLQVGTLESLRDRREVLARAGDKLELVARARVVAEHARLATAETRQRLLDPRSVLRRGFVLVRGTDGRILTTARSVEPGTSVALHFRDGSVRARTESRTLEPEA